MSLPSWRIGTPSPCSSCRIMSQKSLILSLFQQNWRHGRPLPFCCSCHPPICQITTSCPCPCVMEGFAIDAQARMKGCRGCGDQMLLILRAKESAKEFDLQAEEPTAVVVVVDGEGVGAA